MTSREIKIKQLKNRIKETRVIDQIPANDHSEKKPNGFGLYDTVGNVREWALDDYFVSRTNCADAPDPWTPAYNPATDGTSQTRIFVNGAIYSNNSSLATVLSPAYWYGEKWNKDSTANGFRVAFIVK